MQTALQLSQARLAALVLATAVIAVSCAPHFMSFDYQSQSSGSSILWKSTSPSSPSNVSAISLRGTATTDVATIRLYSDASCSTQLGSGSYFEWQSTGIAIAVPVNTTTAIYGAGYTAAGILTVPCQLLTSFLHDNVSPSLTATINSGGTYSLTSGYVNSTVVSLSLTSSDSGSSASGVSQLYITNTPGCAAGKVWEPFTSIRTGWTLEQTNSTATVYIKTKDAAGNESACVAATVVHDNVAPGPVSITINGGAASTTSLNTVLSLSASGSAYQMNVSESATCSTTPVWQTYSNSLAFTLSAGTGSKTIAAQFRDLAGNISSCATATITYDPTAPSLLINSGATYTNTTAVTLSLSATGYSQMYISNTSCLAGGVWEAISATKAWNLASSNATNTVYVRYWDGAAAYACVNAAIIHDNISPAGTTIAINGGATYATTTAVTLTLAATDTNPLEMYVTNTAGCGAGGTWESFSSSKPWTLSQTQGTATVYAKFRDAAQNVSACVNSTILHDATPPVVSISAPSMAAVYLGGTASVITWTATDSSLGLTATPIKIESSSDGGSTWSVIAAATANTGTNPWTAPAATDSNTYQIRVTATDLAGNTASANSGNFSIDSTPPTFKAGTFVLNNGVTTATSIFVPIAFSAIDATDPISSGVYYACFKTSASGAAPTAPAATDPCFSALSTTGRSIDISDAQVFMGNSGGVFTVFGWLKDRAGNVSSLTNSGNGTLGTDKAVITYSPPQAPTIVNVDAANTDGASSPPLNSEMIYNGAGNLYVRWNGSANGGATVSSISISYTSDGKTFTDIATNLANTGNGGCTVSGSYTGCYRAAAIAALTSSSKFQVRVSLTDSNGQITSSLSSPFNTGTLRILAGNTDLGIGGSANAAVIQSIAYASQQFVVLSNGDIYLLGNTTVGLYQIKQSDGILRLLTPTTGTATGDGGLAASATLKDPSRIIADTHDDLYLFDYDRIRKITTSTMVISTLIGGGASTADTIADPLNLSMTPITAINATSPPTGYHNQMTVLPNGQIYFRSNNYPSYGTPLLSGGAAKIRIYTPGSGITTLYPTGTGDSNNATTDLTQRALYGYVPIWSDATQTVLRYLGITQRVLADGTPYTTQSTFNLSAVATAPHPPAFASQWTASDGGTQVARNGQIYLHSLYEAKIFTYDPTNNLWSTFAGNGTTGSCADGTDRLSCPLNANAAYLAPSGQMYFIELGKIRTFDSNGKSATVYGQSTSFGDGGQALSARFATIRNAAITHNGNDRIYILDSSALNIRKAIADGAISKIAGTGSLGAITPGVAATTQPLALSASQSRLAVDATDSYLFLDNYNLGNVNRLDLSTGFWAKLTQGTGGSTNYTSADGLASTVVAWSVRPKVLGINSSVVLVSMANGSDATPADRMFKSYPLAGGSQVHVAGVLGSPSPPPFCANGTAAASCATSAYVSNAVWDSTTNAWIMMDFSAAPQVFRSLGATMSTLTTVTLATPKYAWTYKRTATDQYIFYCSTTGIIYRRAVTAATESILVNLPTGATCDGVTMDYSTSRDSLIFVYKQNGLYGVAEVTGAAP